MARWSRLDFYIYFFHLVIVDIIIPHYSNELLILLYLWARIMMNYLSFHSCDLKIETTLRLAAHWGFVDI